jgi:hypothetical protein
MRKGITPCETCGERLRLVREIHTDTTRPPADQRQERTYWRHWRLGDT